MDYSSKHTLLVTWLLIVCTWTHILIYSYPHGPHAHKLIHTIIHSHKQTHTAKYNTVQKCLTANISCLAVSFFFFFASLPVFWSSFCVSFRNCLHPSPSPDTRKSVWVDRKATVTQIVTLYICSDQKSTTCWPLRQTTARGPQNLSFLLAKNRCEAEIGKVKIRK